MATTNITQLHRVVFRSKETANGDWNTFTLNEADLGSGSVASVNVTPRKVERASQLGTTSTPLNGTYDSLEASITFVANTWKIIGEALGIWNAASYQGAKATDGNIIFGAGDQLCAGGKYVSVIVQGLCDDGSTADVEITRCIPSLSDAIEIGSESANEVTLALNPIIYNPTEHADDGYEPCTIRFGAHSLTTKERLNITTGNYEEVNPES